MRQISAGEGTISSQSFHIYLKTVFPEINVIKVHFAEIIVLISQIKRKYAESNIIKYKSENICTFDSPNDNTVLKRALASYESLQHWKVSTVLSRNLTTFEEVDGKILYWDNFLTLFICSVRLTGVNIPIFAVNSIC